jgi:nucleoside-diphosphate-sugar epimerase
VHKPAQVFCRIHVDDIVGALLHAQAMEQRPPLINVSDNVPCPSSETLGYAAHLLNCKLPQMQRFAEIADAMSPMALSFWADNRRVSNRLLCQELGYQLRYPSYREGFAASLREERDHTCPAA